MGLKKNLQGFQMKKTGFIAKTLSELWFTGCKIHCLLKNLKRLFFSTKSTTKESQLRMQCTFPSSAWIHPIMCTQISSRASKSVGALHSIQWQNKLPPLCDHIIGPLQQPSRHPTRLRQFPSKKYFCSCTFYAEKKVPCTARVEWMSSVRGLVGVGCLPSVIF